MRCPSHPMQGAVSSGTSPLGIPSIFVDFRITSIIKIKRIVSITLQNHNATMIRSLQKGTLHMKHVIQISIFALIAFLILPNSTGAASPAVHPRTDVDLNFAPGSIVRFEHLTGEDGLSQNAGLDIFQDSLGYLWIGTQDGLNRYDGYSFKVYKHDPDDEYSI